MDGARLTTPLLQVRALRAARGGRDVLRNIRFTLAPGELVALMGSSGAGKTCLLRAVAGLDPFDAGEVQVGGITLRAGGASRQAVAAVRQKVGMVFQFHYLFEHLTAAHNVWLAPVHVRGVPRPEAERRALALLGELGVGGRAAALPCDLSGGEAQRVAIARALAMDPPVLLMDEPMASLDPARRADLGSTLRRLADAGRSLLVTSHDDDFVREFATRVLVLAEGVIVEE